MKQQVVAIHGGTSFDTYDEYLLSLKTRELTVDRLKCSDDWKALLGDELGESFEVLVPRMPNPSNANYLEWCIWFERCSAFVENNVILIGHSLGGIFLAKYLSEHPFPKLIKATVLVGAPFDDTSTNESLADFALTSSLEQFSTQGGKIFVVHSKDDPIVPFEEVAKYKEALPSVKEMIFEDRGHFNQETFPEMVELIRSL